MVITYWLMLFLVGVQVGIIILPRFGALHSISQVMVIMGYWALVAAVFVIITNWQMKQAYDRPMRRLSEATKKVAGGDFSVYVEPFHTTDKYDYIDVMFTDFNKMVAELGSIETLKNDFIANVSHEIKTPLAVIRNYATMLKKEGLSHETQMEYAGTITASVDRLASLVTDILRLNKLENQEIIPAPEPFDLCEQLCSCALQFEPLWDQKNIEFTADLEDRLMVYGDASMLEIVWNNLLSNAFKFTGPGGKVLLTQMSRGNTITVTVSDTGCGMTPETMRHIFDKFYQGDASRSREGNGLGLAMAYRIIEKMNGTLTVTSEPDKGSVFTVTLPKMG